MYIQRRNPPGCRGAAHRFIPSPSAPYKPCLTALSSVPKSLIFEQADRCHVEMVAAQKEQARVVEDVRQKEVRIEVMG